MKKVICFGEILWDNLPSGRLAGGAPMNVAYHLRKLGIDASLISRVGNDKAGQDLIDFLSSIQIPSTGIQIDNSQSTSEVIAELKANNEMSYTIVYPTAWDFIEWKNEYENLVQNSDILVYGSLSSRPAISRKTLLTALEIAKYKVFDVNLRAPHYEKDTVRDLLQYANLVKLNENEIVILSEWFTSFTKEEDQIKALRDQFNIEEIIITKGANGSSYYSKDRHIFQDSFAVDVIDTVGSGDSFLAGFLAQKLAGKPTEEAFKFANSIAAFITTKAGACPNYTLQDINTHLRLA